MQVFLSYSRKDAAFVRRLAADLEGADIDVWLDTEDLASADEDRWRRSIVQGIRQSAAIVVVLSPDSVLSGAVERELTIAAEATRRIIPIVHRQCELPDGFLFELAGVQRIDFTEQPYDKALNHLVRRIAAAPSAASSAPGLPPPHSSPSPEAPVVGLPPVASDPSAAVGYSATVPTSGSNHPGDEHTENGPLDRPERATTGPAAPETVLPGPTTRGPVVLPHAAVESGLDAPGGPERLTLREPSAGRSAWTWAFVALVVVAFVGTIGVIVARSDGGGDADDDASSQTTGIATEAQAQENANQGTSPAPTSTTPTSASEAATDENTPESTSPPPADTAPTAVNEAAPALTLIEDLQEAYNNRDWDTVRRINTEQANVTDDRFVEGYGSADGLPRLVQGFHVILETEATGATSWRVLGTIVAWDYMEDASQSTNVACAKWEVDTAHGTAAQTGFTGSDGLSARRLPGWLTQDRFDAIASEFCR
jgi:type II secretory pathway pseudopilin PulG